MGWFLVSGFWFLVSGFWFRVQDLGLLDGGALKIFQPASSDL